MMENKLIVQNMDDIGRASKAMAASGYFTDASKVAEAAVKVMAGYEMGFGPFAAMTGIHIIKGKPAIGSNLIAAAIKRHPLYNYKVVEHDNKVCKIEFYENWNGTFEMVGVSEFSIEDAAKAGLSTNPKNETWTKYPKNMLFSRAISNGAKFYCPDVFGGSPTYTPEELGANVDEDENVIAGEIVDVDETIESAPQATQSRNKPQSAASAPKNAPVANPIVLEGISYSARLAEVVTSTGERYIDCADDKLSYMKAAIKKRDQEEGADHKDNKRKLTAIAKITELRANKADSFEGLPELE